MDLLVVIFSGMAVALLNPFIGVMAMGAIALGLNRESPAWACILAAIAYAFSAGAGAILVLLIYFAARVAYRLVATP